MPRQSGQLVLTFKARMRCFIPARCIHTALLIYLHEHTLECSVSVIRLNNESLADGRDTGCDVPYRSGMLKGSYTVLNCYTMTLYLLFGLAMGPVCES